MRASPRSRPAGWNPGVVPRGLLRLDRTHPLAQGLVACYVPGAANGPIDLTGNGPLLTYAAAAKIAAGPRGPGLLSTANDSDLNVPAASFPSAWALTTQGSMFWAADLLGAPSNQPTFFAIPFNAGYSAPEINLALAQDFTSNHTSFLYGPSGAGLFTAVASGNTPGTATKSVGASFIVGGAIALYENGVSTASATWSGAAPSFASSPILTIGADIGGGDYANGTSIAAYLYNVPLSAAMFAWLSAEPFAMLVPATRRSRVFLSSGGATSATPGVGSVLLTGSVATVAYGTSLVPGAGSIVFTGKALSPNQAVLPGVGSVIFTGAAPTVASGNTALPGAGSAVLTGLAPTLAYGTSLVPGVGSVVLTGQAPSVGATVFPSVGAVVLTGAAPTVTFTILPGAGSAVLTGKVPTVAFGVTVLPGAGSVVVSGLAPTVAYGTALTPGVGAIVFTGFAPPASGSTNANPGVGSIVFTGKVPTIAAGISLTPGAGAVVFGGSPPTRAAGNSLTPGGGSIALAGLVPSVSSAGSPTNASPQAGSVVISGASPTAVYSTVILPGLGAVMIAGAAPLVVAGALGIAIVPGVGLVTFGGLSPSVLTAPAPTLLTNELYVVSVPGVLRTVSAPAPLRTVSVPGVVRTVSGRSTTMAQATQLSPMDVGASEPITFDFAPQMSAGQVISGTPTVTCIVSSASTGTDPTPSVRVIGTPQIGASPSTSAPNMAVRQQVGGVLGGVTYTLQCLAQVGSSVLSLWARIPGDQPN